MANVLKTCLIALLLTSCSATNRKGLETAFDEQPTLSLTEKVQVLVTSVQSDAINGLPAEISEMKSEEPVADREKNQKGAGFTRVYELDDAVATVFVYNNQDFGMGDEVSPALETLMDKHLQEFISMQDAGLYENVKIGDKKPREFRWRSVKYHVLEATVQFSQKDEPKRSFLVLAANKDLMSYIRIRFTYPRTMQTRISKLQNVFTRTVLVAMHDFAEALKPKPAVAE